MRLLVGLALTAAACGGPPPVDPFMPTGCVPVEQREACTIDLGELNPEVGEATWKDAARALCQSRCGHLDTMLVAKTDTLGSLRQLGLEGVRSARSFGISRNRNLKNLEGLENLEEVEVFGVAGVGESFSLKGFRIKRALANSSVFSGIGLQSMVPQDLDALDSLEEATAIRVVQIQGLRKLDAFNGLRRVHIVRIEENPDLEEIAGFSAVPEIWSNPALFGGEVFSEFILANNLKLKAITGFSAVRRIERLAARRNPQLSECHVREKFRGVPSTDVLIAENGPCR